MEPSVMVALTITVLAGGGSGFNETTHGGMADAMGMGHHHLFGDEGWHCGRGEPGARHPHPDGTACTAYARACPPLTPFIHGGATHAGRNARMTPDRPAWLPDVAA